MPKQMDANKPGMKAQQARSNQLLLIEHSLRVLPHHYEMIRLQQEVRDRWQRYYLIVTGSVISVVIAAFVAYFNSRTVLLSPDAQATYIYKRLGWMIPLAFFLVAILGFIYLMLYLSQIKNYRVTYQSVERVYRLLSYYHSTELSRSGLPNPFTFVHGVHTQGHRRRGIKGIINPQLWEAEFWANMLVIVASSFSISVAWYAWETWRSFMGMIEPAPMEVLIVHGLELFGVACISLVVVRQLVMLSILSWVDRELSLPRT